MFVNMLITKRTNAGITRTANSSIPLARARREVAKTAIDPTTKSQVPSGTYLSLAVGSIGLSLALRLMGQKHAATFVGQWVPTILILGLYNKVVKVEGSE